MSKKAKLFYVILSGVLGFVIGVSISFPFDKMAHAEFTHYNIVAVELSESCKTMLAHGDKSTCPTIGDLMIFDNTNQKISGKFINDAAGNWLRTKPQLTNHYMFYENKKLPVVCIDCSIPLALADIVKTVIIEPKDSSFTFIDKFESINDTRIQHTYHDRYMQGCNTATIAYTMPLTADTIFYMRSGCTQTTYDNSITKILPDSHIDYSKSPAYVYKSWQDNATQQSKTQSCITQHCGITPNPQRNWS